MIPSPRDLENVIKMKKPKSSYVSAMQLNKFASNNQKLGSKMESAIKKRETSLIQVISIMQEIEDKDLMRIIAENKQDEGESTVERRDMTSNTSDLTLLTQTTQQMEGELTISQLEKNIVRRVHFLES